MNYNSTNLNLPRDFRSWTGTETGIRKHWTSNPI